MKKRILSLLLAILMLMSIVPITSLVALAAANPVAYGTLNHPVWYNSPNQETGASPDLGWTSYARKMYFDPVKAASGLSLDKTNSKFCGAEKLSQAYCINHGGKFTARDMTKYVAYRAQDSKYFKNFDDTQKMGIVLVANFGYPAQWWEDLGAKNEEDAIIATQALMWEFNLNSRTRFTDMPDNGKNPEWAYQMVKDDEGARTAYWNILSAAQNFLDMGGKWKEILDSKYLLIWENSKHDDAQVVLTFTGTSENPFGSISVIKEDINGKRLAGAEFAILYSDKNSPNYGKQFGELLVTDSNGYAITEGGKQDPSVPYGTYTIVEKTPPTYTDPNGKVCEYIPVGPTSWTVVVDDEHKHVPLSATNREKKYVKIKKKCEELDLNNTVKEGLIKDKTFAIYDNETGVCLLTLTTDEKGETPKDVVLPQTKSGVYRWEEITQGDYSCAMKKGDKWVSASEPWIFKYDDIAAGDTLVLEAMNIATYGYGIVKKVISGANTSGYSDLAGFHFEIKDYADESLVAKGVTNADGFLVCGNRVGVVNTRRDFKTAPFTYKIEHILENYGIAKLDKLNINADAEMERIFKVEDTVTLKDFFKEIDVWDGSVDYEYAVLDVQEPSNLKIYTEKDQSNASSRIGQYQFILLKYVNGKWELQGCVSKYSDVQSALNLLKGTNFTANGTKEITLKDIVDKIKIEADKGYSPIYGLNFVYTIFALDLNFDGVLNKEDISLANDAKKRGQTTLENPIITLHPGKYKLTEILDEETKQDLKYTAPTSRTFIVYPDRTTTIEFENHEKAAAIQIIKEAEDGNINGTEFEIAKKNANEGYDVIQKVKIENNNDTIFISKDPSGGNLLAGTYRITEINIDGRYGTPITEIDGNDKTRVVGASRIIEISDKDLANGDLKVYTVKFINPLKKLDLNIYKSSDDGKVDGFKFRVTGYDVLGNYIDKQGTTVDNGNLYGELSFRLYPGKYYVNEILPDDSEYVTQKTQVIEPYIDSDGKVRNNVVYFHNVLKHFTLTVNKVDALNGELHGDGTLEGAVYGLYNADGKLVEKKSTDKDGKLTFSTRVMEMGYTVREISPSEGYYIDNTVYDIDTNPANYNQENVNLNITVIETPIFGNISIHKRKGTEEDNVPEEGATFVIYLKSAGSYEASPAEARDIIITDKADPTDPMGYFGGTATTKNMPYGTYVVHQISGDDRFARIPDFEVKIDKEHINECYVRLNPTTDKQITLYKKDASKDIYLEGAVFRVLDEHGVAQSGTTDKDGKVTFTLKPAASYMIIEDKAPEGYSYNPTHLFFTLDIYGNVSEGTTIVENDHNKYVVKKVDDEGNPLAGATFAMINVDTGKTFKEVTTGEDGLAVFEYIPFGNYEVKEIAAPAGYKLCDTILTLSVDGKYENLGEGTVNAVISDEDTVITFTKTEITTAEGIPGATITIYDADGNVYAEGVTDENGEYTIRNIVSGKYTFKETYAPEGFEINTTVFEFEITAEGEVVGGTNITDKPNKYVVKKVDDEGNPLADATFEMKNTETGEIFATITTGEDGLALFSSIPYGTYEVRETKAPAGFKLSDEVFTIVVDGEYMNLGEGEINESLLNEDTVVIFSKTDITTAEKIPGATITVYDEQGNVYAEGVTDENGEFIIKNIIPGKYTFKETYAPEGFEINTTVFEFEVTAEGEVIGNTEITDKPNKYVVKKVDDEGNPLADATFEMKNTETGEIFATVITDENGLAVFNSIPYGSYEVYEIEAPAGYKLSEEIFSVVVDGTWMNAEDELNDTLVNSDTEVIINKIDADTGAGIPGATITIYDVDGNVYTEGVTDENGQFIIKNILVGKYTFKETAAPELYELNDTVFAFEVTAKGEVLGDTTVSDVHNKYVVKKTDKDGKSLAGATFEMKNVETGEVFATVITGEDGLAIFENIPFGKYEVRETESPAGYKLSKEVLEVEITDTWKNLPEGEFNGTIINEDTVITFTKTEITTAEGIPGATITVYDADGNVYAEGKTDKNGEFTIYNIVPGKYTFVETYAPSGFEINTTVFEFEITIEGDVLGGTNITDKPNKYVVKKTDKDGNVLAGAIFEMKNVETGEIFATVITDEDGIALFSSIPYGTYEIYETKAPDGYKLSDKVFTLVVDGEYMNLGESEFNDILVNEDTVVIFNKTDASNGEAVPGAEITVYDENGEIYAQGITDENGQFTIYNIIPGKYTFVETYAPDGFKLNKTVFEFEITAEGEVIGATDITNEPIKVFVTKTDLTGEKTIPGAEITIYDANGEEVFKDITDENGVVSVTYLAPGVYTFKETAAANGWAINTSIFTFTIDAEGNVSGDDTITDDVTRVKILKVNEKNEPLAGVVFNVYDKNGNLVTSQTTDENGEAIFEGLRWNEYTIKEVSTIDGYYLANDSIKIVMDDQWDNASDLASVTVINYPIPQTGDRSNMLWYIGFALISAIGIAVFCRRKRVIG